MLRPVMTLTLIITVMLKYNNIHNDSQDDTFFYDIDNIKSNDTHNSSTSNTNSATNITVTSTNNNVNTSNGHECG